MDDELLRLLGRHQREDLEGSAELEDAPTPYAGVEREELLDDLFAKLEVEPSGAQAELAPVDEAAELAPVDEAAEPVPSAAAPVSAVEPAPSPKVVELAPRRARQRNLILLGSLSTAVKPSAAPRAGIFVAGEEPKRRCGGSTASFGDKASGEKAKRGVVMGFTTGS